MSTRTPNLGLYKPDSNDPLADFRTEFNNNMDILDNGGGGGGGGGHTIVDENGQSMPSRLKLAFTGNVEVTDDSGNNETLVNILGGGGGGSDTIVGMFVDTSRIITSGTWSSSLSYTATEDCFVYVEGTTNNTHLIVNVDGVKVFDLGSSNFVAQYKLYPLKKGQILTATKSDGFTLNYIVYGVTQGTKGVFTPIIYSDNERCIGIWRDNKPLYQRTFDLGSDISISNTSWYSSIVSITSVENITHCFGLYSGGTYYPLMAYHTGDNVNVLACRANSGATVRYLTLCYTKTSDSAGSGNWSTDEEPMHHYSTSEKLVGTWIDGKPLYEITVDVGTLPNRATKSVNYGVADVKAIVKLYGIGIASTGASCPLPFSDDYSPAGNILLDANASSETIRLISQSDKSPFHGYVTMQYTKTTDT